MSEAGKSMTLNLSPQEDVALRENTPMRNSAETGVKAMTTPSMVQRWEQDSRGDWYTCDLGDWCKSADVSTLEARCAELERVEAVNQGLRGQHARDSAELRSLCAARDEYRKERDEWKSAASEFHLERDKAEAERDAFKLVLDDEVAENLAYMDKAGNLPDENITKVMYRVLAERDELRRRIDEAPRGKARYSSGPITRDINGCEFKGQEFAALCGKECAVVVMEDGGDA